MYNNIIIISLAISRAEKMSSVEIEIVSVPNLQKIESFFNDSTYRETLEISANFNTRLCVERKNRMPFLDPQTGVAQKHCHLFMQPRQRMPGSREGQLYSYPSKRWRKSKRQYLQRIHHNNFRPFRGFRNAGDFDDPMSVSLHHDDSSSLGASCDADLNRTTGEPSYKDDLPKDWLYEDMELNDLDGTDEAELGDSDFEYNVNGYKRKTTSNRRKSRPSDRSKKSESGGSGSGSSSRRSRPSGSSSSRSSRSRKKTAATVERDHDFQDQYMPAFEPPSFDSAAESLGGDVNGDLRSYRKY